MKTGSKLLSAARVFAAMASAIPVIFAAAAARGDPNETAWLAARPIAQDPIEWGNDGPFRVPLVLLVTSAAQWNATMDSLALLDELTVLPAPPPPSINWRRDAVILVSLGEFTELHCYVDIREMRHIGLQVLCDVRVDVLPSPRIQVFTNPYFVVKIGRRGDRGAAAARFENRYLGSPNEPSTVTYSDRDAFFKTGDREPTGGVSWGAVKSLFR